MVLVQSILRSFEFRITLLYFFISAIWILFSDQVVSLFISDPVQITSIQTYKGWGYILFSSLLLFFLLHRQANIRKRAEMDYTNIFENAAMGVFQSTPEGRFLRVNGEMARIFGYDSPAEMVRDIHQISEQIYTDPNERQRFVETLEREGVVEGFEGLNRRRDGRVIWTNTSARLVRDEQGVPRYFEGFVQDISDRKRMEKIEGAIYKIAQASISTRTLDELYVFIHHALASILPAENFYIALYDSAADLLTFPYFVDQLDEPSPPKKPGRGLTEYVLRTQKPLLASPEVFQDLLQRGEVEMIGTDSIDWLGVPLMIDGRIIGVMVVQSYQEGTRYSEREMEILSFISAQAALAIERKRAESALQESEERYRYLVDHSPIGIVVHCAGEVAFINQTALHKLGAERAEEIIGKPIVNFIHPDFLPKTLEQMQRLMNGENIEYPIEDLYLRLDGTPIPVEVSAALTTFQGRQAVQLTLNDISERKKAQSALERQLNEMRVINEVAAACSQSTDLDELISRTTQIISTTLYPDNCGVLIANPVQGVWKPHASYHGISFEMRGNPHPFSVGIAGKVAFSGEGLRVGDIRSESAYLESTSGIRSELAVPIFLDGQVFGVLNAESRQLNAFSETDQKLMETIADNLATAIKKIRLLQSEQQRRMETEILHEANLSLTGSLDLSSRLETILDKLPLFAKFDRAAILLFAIDGMEVVGERGLPASRLWVGQILPDSGLSDELAALKAPILIPDTHNDRRYLPFEGCEDTRSWMGIPLIAYERVIGFIQLENREAESFNRQQAALLQSFANQAAVAIENARLYESEQRRRKENARLLDELQVNTFELSLAYDKTLEGWARALEIRDRDTSGHTRRVTEMTIRLARRMGVSEKEIPHIRRGVLLHDIGKMGIPDTILKKSGPLTSDEWGEMRKHPQYAFDMLYPIAYLRPALDIPYCHHEKWNGSGYPRGLKGEEIPLTARVFSVIDVWDALLHDRPYRKAWALKDVIAYIWQESGVSFDPQVVKVFLGMVQEEAQ